MTGDEYSENELDELILSYFELLDRYQDLQKQLGKSFSSGFLSLAQANYSSTTGRRYGQDYYDERMQAMRGVTISKDGNAASFAIREFPLEKEEEVAAKDEGKSGGLRQRKSAKPSSEATSAPNSEPADKPEEDEEQEPPKPKRDPRDPLKWFGILLPQGLRDAQKDFTSALTTSLDLQSLTNEIAVTVHKIEAARSGKSYRDAEPELLKELEALDVKDEN